METIKKKVKAKKLVECGDLHQMTEHAWDVVHAHCSGEFYDSWESIARASVDVISEEFFFRNYLWCVYVSGFSAKAVTANYDKLLVAHNLVDERGKFVPSEKASPPDKDQVFKIWRNHAKFNAHDLCVGARESCLRMADWPLGKVDLLLWYAAATIRS